LKKISTCPRNNGRLFKLIVVLSGVQVKMITGDQLEIAQETGRRLGMGDAMYVYNHLVNLAADKDSMDQETELNKIVLCADGFANVFPEHKYEIVRRLQDMEHMVAMTGKFYHIQLLSHISNVRRWCQRCTSFGKSKCRRGRSRCMRCCSISFCHCSDRTWSFSDY
jgi:hypothetical protein